MIFLDLRDSEKFMDHISVMMKLYCIIYTHKTLLRTGAINSRYLNQAGAVRVVWFAGKTF
jgi:hypothetical protein